MKEQSPLTPRYEVVEQLKSARKAQNVTPVAYTQLTLPTMSLV